MSEPDLIITVEPFESGKVVYLPLAPQTSNHDPKGRLFLLLSIKNRENRKVTLTDLKISFVGPPEVSSVPRSFGNLEIAADATVKWAFQRPGDDVILPVPAPQKIKLSVSCHGFDQSKKVTFPLAPHKSPTPEGSYLFPASASDLEHNEFWNTEGDVHPVGFEGNQSFAYDMGVVGYDPQRGWSGIKPNTSGQANKDHRAWGKPIHAMADGIVRHFLNDVPSNPHPLQWASHEELLEKLDEQRKKYWGDFELGYTGNHFYIQHGDEIVVYAHLRRGTLERRFLHDGAHVNAGDFLGLAGNSGNSSSPHLHIHAIQGQVPDVGPLRPILFRDAQVISLESFTPPGPGGAWVSMEAQGIPKVSSLIYPAPMPPIYVVPGNWRAIVYILFGITEGGGGLGFTPGGNPVPIDPEGTFHLTAEKRDILLGLAMTELAPLASNAKSRAEIEKTGVNAMTNALNQMNKRL